MVFAFRGVLFCILASVGLQQVNAQQYQELECDDDSVNLIQGSATKSVRLVAGRKSGRHSQQTEIHLEVSASPNSTAPRTAEHAEVPEHRTVEPGPDENTKEIQASAVWDAEKQWFTVSSRHPSGVISSLPSHMIEWNDVSYLNMSILLCFCAVGYPAALVALLLVLTVLTSMCLVVDKSTQYGPSAVEQTDPEVSGTEQCTESPPEAITTAGGEILKQFQQRLPVLPTHSLTATSRKVYACWALFCCMVPCMMVFGNPVLMMFLARPYPQEVLASLNMVTSAFIFANSIYMLFFGGRGLMEISMSNDVEYASILPEGHESQVAHWVILPQYKEDVEVVSMTLRSVACSSMAKSSISIVLAMEEREEGAQDKVALLKRSFEGQFKEIIAVYHPPNLPKDPPGKASNLCYAFKELLHHIGPSEEEASKVVLTVADADSEFHSGYFESLACHFLGTDLGSRFHRLWQAPVFHMKNYHRQPAPVVVGTMFTGMQEMSNLSDPNAVRFPYSTYSLSLKLARHVGGWDAEWIAEDYHMGIKCFLMTLGKALVEPIMLPTVNYVPEENSWLGTCMARWTQLKRHALGFSDFAYYFMMLPLIFSYSTTATKQRSRIDGFVGFWRMLSYGSTLIVRLLNVHVLIGVLSTYGALALILKFLMKFAFRSDRYVEFLFENLGVLPTYLTICSVGCTILVSTMFFKVYRVLMSSGRIEDKPDIENPLLHWLKNLIGLALSSPFYFVMLGYAIWCAALSVLTQSSFEYEVAPKPTKHSDEGPSKMSG